MRPFVTTSISCLGPAARWKAQLLDADAESLREPFYRSLSGPRCACLPLAECGDAYTGARSHGHLSKCRWYVGGASKANDTHLVGDPVVGGHCVSLNGRSTATSRFTGSTTFEETCRLQLTRSQVAHLMAWSSERSLTMATGRERGSPPRCRLMNGGGKVPRAGIGPRRRQGRSGMNVTSGCDLSGAESGP
jgi:hypothetical protein